MVILDIYESKIQFSHVYVSLAYETRTNNVTYSIPKVWLFKIFSIFLNVFPKFIKNQWNFNKNLRFLKSVIAFGTINFSEKADGNNFDPKKARNFGVSGPEREGLRWRTSVCGWRGKEFLDLQRKVAVRHHNAETRSDWKLTNEE